jgi:phage shock protein C
MDCASCKTVLEHDSVFCRVCGRPTTGRPEQARRLYRHSADGRLAGVCAGIADYLDVDVTVVRLGWIILAIVPGAFVGGIVAYIAAALVMPVGVSAAAEQPRARRRVTRSLSDRKIAGVCGGIADFFALDPTVVRVVWIVLTIVPGMIVFGIAAYLVAWFIMPEAPRQALTAAPTAA